MRISPQVMTKYPLPSDEMVEDSCGALEIKEFSSHIFWSYNQSAELKPEIIIKQVISYGEVKDMILLVEKVGRNMISI